MSDAQYKEGGGDNPPYREDFFQRIVNVSWAKKGAFLFTGGNVTLNSYWTEPFPGAGITFNYPWTDFTCTSGTSRDGKKWNGKAYFYVGGGIDPKPGNNGGSIFNCGISAAAGSNRVYVAGGMLIVALDASHQTPGNPETFTHGAPFTVSSSDGVNWKTAIHLEPIHPTFDSECLAVGFNPKTQTFYAVVQGLTGNPADSSTWTTVTKLYKWTETSTKPSSPVKEDVTLFNSTIAESFLTSLGFSSVRYVACNFPGQIMHFEKSGKKGTLQLIGQQLAINGSTVGTPKDSVQSAAVNADGSAIVVSCMSNDNGSEDNPKPNPFLYMSSDQGTSWLPVFPDATTRGLGNGGSVSFSP